MDYCGVAVGHEFHHLCTLREVRAEEPPIRLAATFYEPGGVEAIIAQLRSLGRDAVVAIAGPSAPGAGEPPRRRADAELSTRGVPPHRFEPSAVRLFDGLAYLGAYAPHVPRGQEEATAGLVEEGAFRAAGLFETNVEGVFCALQGRRLPARRHPLGILRRVQELADDQVLDSSGDLWHRRIEEIDAAAAALCAHRYAVGHACWVGDPNEAVIVLPGSRLPSRFSSEGVLPRVERVPLPTATAAP